eukprot:PhF_6_TR29365/c0_g1_i1/m.43215
MLNSTLIDIHLVSVFVEGEEVDELYSVATEWTKADAVLAETPLRSRFKINESVVFKTQDLHSTEIAVKIFREDKGQKSLLAQGIFKPPTAMTNSSLVDIVCNQTAKHATLRCNVSVKPCAPDLDKATHRTLHIQKGKFAVNAFSSVRNASLYFSLTPSVNAQPMKGPEFKLESEVVFEDTAFDLPTELEDSSSVLIQIIGPNGPVAGCQSNVSPKPTGVSIPIKNLQGQKVGDITIVVLITAVSVVVVESKAVEVPVSDSSNQGMKGIASPKGNTTAPSTSESTPAAPLLTSLADILAAAGHGSKKAEPKKSVPPPALKTQDPPEGRETTEKKKEIQTVVAKDLVVAKPEEKTKSKAQPRQNADMQLVQSRKTFRLMIKDATITKPSHAVCDLEFPTCTVRSVVFTKEALPKMISIPWDLPESDLISVGVRVTDENNGEQRIVKASIPVYVTARGNNVDIGEGIKLTYEAMFVNIVPNFVTMVLRSTENVSVKVHMSTNRRVEYRTPLESVCLDNNDAHIKLEDYDPGYTSLHVFVEKRKTDVPMPEYDNGIHLTWPRAQQGFIRLPWGDDFIAFEYVWVTPLQLFQNPINRVKRPKGLVDYGPESWGLEVLTLSVTSADLAATSMTALQVCVECGGSQATFDVQSAESEGGMKIGAFIYGPYHALEAPMQEPTTINILILNDDEEIATTELKISSVDAPSESVQLEGFSLGIQQHLFIGDETRHQESQVRDIELREHDWNNEDTGGPPKVKLNHVMKEPIACQEVRATQGNTVVRLDDRTVVVHGGVNMYNLFEPHSFLVDTKNFHWTQIIGATDVSMLREGHTAVLYDGQIWYHGGVGPMGLRPGVYRPSSLGLRPLKVQNIHIFVKSEKHVDDPREQHKMIKTQGHCPTGYHCSIIRHSPRASPNESSWSMIESQGNPSFRSQHIAAVRHKKMYVWGGWGLLTEQGLPAAQDMLDIWETRLNTMECFDFQTRSWSVVSQQGLIPCARTGHSGVVHDSKWYVFGGSQGDMTKSAAQAESIVISQQSRSIVPFRPDQVQEQPNSAVGLLNDFHVFDFGSSTWSAVRVQGKVRPTPREGHGACIGKYENTKCLFVYGGISSSGAGENLHADKSCYTFVFATSFWREVEINCAVPNVPCRFGMVAITDNAKRLAESTASTEAVSPTARSHTSTRHHRGESPSNSPNSKSKRLRKTMRLPAKTLPAVQLLVVGGCQPDKSSTMNARGHRFLEGKICLPQVLNFDVNVPPAPDDTAVSPTRSSRKSTRGGVDASSIRRPMSSGGHSDSNNSTRRRGTSVSSTSIQLMTGAVLTIAKRLDTEKQQEASRKKYLETRKELLIANRVDSVKAKYTNGLAQWRPEKPKPAPPPPERRLTVADQEYVNRRVYYDPVTERAENVQQMEEELELQRGKIRKFKSQNEMYDHLQNIYYTKAAAAAASKSVEAIAAAKLSPEALMASVERLYYKDLNDRLVNRHALEEELVPHKPQKTMTRSQWNDTVRRLHASADA